MPVQRISPRDHYSLWALLCSVFLVVHNLGAQAAARKPGTGVVRFFAQLVVQPPEKRFFWRFLFAFHPRSVLLRAFQTEWRRVVQSPPDRHQTATRTDGGTPDCGQPTGGCGRSDGKRWTTKRSTRVNHGLRPHHPVRLARHPPAPFQSNHEHASTTPAIGAAADGRPDDPRRHRAVRRTAAGHPGASRPADRHVRGRPVSRRPAVRRPATTRPVHAAGRDHGVRTDAPVPLRPAAIRIGDAADAGPGRSDAPAAHFHAVRPTAEERVQSRRPQAEGAAATPHDASGRDRDAAPR